MADLEMMVCLNDQRRFINVNPADNMRAIEQACFGVYQMKRKTQHQRFQVQFYETQYKTFVDFESNESKFKQLLNLLASSSSPPKPDVHWQLRIIHTVLENGRL